MSLPPSPLKFEVPVTWGWLGKTIMGTVIVAIVTGFPMLIGSVISLKTDIALLQKGQNDLLEQLHADSARAYGPDSPFLRRSIYMREHRELEIQLQELSARFDAAENRILRSVSQDRNQIKSLIERKTWRPRNAAPNQEQEDNTGG